MSITLRKYAYIAMYILGFAVVALVLSVIVVWIRNWGKETFANAPPPDFKAIAGDPTQYFNTMQKYTKGINDVKEKLEDAVDKFGDLSDKECDVFKNVEATYISSNSVPTGESEYSLPADVKKKKQDAREERAKKRFQDEKTNFEKQNKTKLLECFEDASGASAPSSEDISGAENDLNTAINEINNFFDGETFNSLKKKGPSTFMTYIFNGPYLKKAVAATTSRPRPPTTATTATDATPATDAPTGPTGATTTSSTPAKTEGFYDAGADVSGSKPKTDLSGSKPETDVSGSKPPPYLTGEKLLRTAAQILQISTTVKTAIDNGEKSINEQVEINNVLMKKAADLQEGGAGKASKGDIDNAVSNLPPGTEVPK